MNCIRMFPSTTLKGFAAGGSKSSVLSPSRAEPVPCTCSAGSMTHRPPVAWQRFLVAVSFANLCFLRRWKESITYTPPDQYLMLVPPAPAQYYASMFDTLLVAAFTWAFIVWMERNRQGAAYKSGRYAFLVLMLLPLNALREALSGDFPYLHGELIRGIGLPATLGVITIVGVGLLVVILCWPDQLYRSLRAALLFLSPFVLLTFGQAGLDARHYDPAGFQDKPLAQPIANRTDNPRVAWVVFDELDERITFDARPRDLQLPELDRFRNGSLHASEAFPPTGATLSSLPSLILGRKVKRVEKLGPSELRIGFGQSDAMVDWSTQPNVFSRARTMGLNTALAGWYHPYCRI